MADNAYTAFDPVFYSLHSNIDRVFDKYLVKNRDQQFTSSFPIQPFAGPFAKDLSLGDPRSYVYTTIGDMVKPTKALGYTYGIPVSPDADSKLDNTRIVALAIPREPELEDSCQPIVVFHDVKCNTETYTVDVFVSSEREHQELQPCSDNSAYFGKMTLLGMGDSQTTDRCIKQGIKRTMFAREGWGHEGDRNNLRVQLLVKEVKSGRIITDDSDEYYTINGLKVTLEWARYIADTPVNCKSSNCKR